MATGYTKEFLIDAFCYRYEQAGLSVYKMRRQASEYFDTVSKDKFRESCSLDAEAIRQFKNFCLEAGLEY